MTPSARLSVDLQDIAARLHTEDSARIAMLEAELRKVWPGTQDDLRARLDWVRMMSLSRESLQKLGLEAPNTGAEL
jgi:chromosomal replication initiation ATPase DnaA